eukprot:gene13418-14794_t
MFRSLNIVSSFKLTWYLIRLHLSNGDSSQNEIERCHAYIGDAICDGAGLDWEYKKLYNEKTIKVVKKMSIDELREYELKRMEYNAYHVCDEVTSRIDGAPGPGGFLKSYRAVKKKDLFFKDKEFLDSFLSKSGKEQAGLPGGKYYSKISNFITDHCEIGEKHLEFLKFECRNRKDGVCDYCKCHDWVGPPCTKVPRPYPDYSKLPEYHYQHVSVTPKVLNGVEREVDDFQPRKKIKEFFESEGITAFEENKLQEFCNKYIIEMSVVRQYLEHLQTLELNKEKRKLERKRNISEENLQNYEDIDWVSHYKNSSLKQLKVKTLDKYLEKHEMTAYLSVKKKDKVVAITYHIAFQQLQRSLAVKNKAKKRVMPELQSESDDDEEDDVIIDIAGKEDSSNTSSEGEESQDETPEISNNDEFEEDLSHLFCEVKISSLVLQRVRLANMTTRNEKCVVHYKSLALDTPNLTLLTSEAYQRLLQGKNARIKFGGAHYHQKQIESVPAAFIAGEQYTHRQCYQKFTKAIPVHVQKSAKLGRGQVSPLKRRKRSEEKSGILFPNVCMKCKTGKPVTNKGKKQYPKVLQTFLACETVKRAAELHNDTDMKLLISGEDLVAKKFKMHSNCYRDYTRICSKSSSAPSPAVASSTSSAIDDTGATFDDNPDTLKGFQLVCSFISNNVIEGNEFVSLKILTDMYGFDKEDSRWRFKVKQQVQKEFGEKVAYDKVHLIETAQAELVRKLRSQENPLPILPANELEKVLTFFWWDNFDIKKETIQGSYHTTHEVAFQEKSSSNLERNNAIEILSSNKKSITYQPLQLSKPKILTHKNPELFETAILNQEYNGRFADDLILLWGTKRRILSKPSQSVARFVAWVVKSFGVQDSNITNITFLPPIFNPITEYSTVLECIKQLQQLASVSQMKYAHITVDAGSAQKFFHVVWNNPDKFNNVIVHLGDFHAMMEFFGNIGKFVS